jgi:hypothetical protein
MRNYACLLLLVAACSGKDASILRRHPSGTTDDVSPTDPTGGAGGEGAGAASKPDAGADANVDAGPWPGSDVILLPFAPQKNANVGSCGAVLADLAKHIPPMYGTQYDIPSDCVAWGEALTIGIDSHITNYVNPYAAKGVAAGGFYVTKDRMAFVLEPATTRLSHVSPMVPASLRGPMFQVNLVDAVADWDATPTFILDEWVVQTNGADVAVELGKDDVSGAFELTMYALAFGAAVEAHEPLDAQLVQFLAWHAERAMTLYRAAAKSPSALYAAWQTSADAKPLRNFARRVFSGPYVAKVLEIGAAKE